MANFSDVKKSIETDIITKAKVAEVLYCVDDTGDMLEIESDGTVELVEAFSSKHPWFMVEVVDDNLKKITVGKGLSRVYGSILFTVYSPSGQGGSGGAKITDFIYNNFHANRVDNTLLRNVRTMGKFKLPGWTAKILQVSFEHNVNIS